MFNSCLTLGPVLYSVIFFQKLVTAWKQNISTKETPIPVQLQVTLSIVQL